MIFLILLPITLSENLYQLDSLETAINVQAGFALTAEKSTAHAQEVSADLLLFPQNSPRQKTIKISTEGSPEKDRVTFHWDSPQAGRYPFGYEAVVQTTAGRTEVHSKVSFPLTNIQGYEQYTRSTAKIDSDNPAIIRQAAKLAEGEDDLFKVAFNLASWVANNVDYDLNELTTETAQPASWVLQNRQGVCDEMTSLFVAMARSLGIPARFVSGISYTEHPDILSTLGTNWASHGWAEIYFPDIGWVSFDIAFDEYGYIDVTHIKLREGLDPDEPATKFQWLASGIELQPEKISLSASVQSKGNRVQDPISIQQELLASEVDAGSYNLVKGILRNTAPYYTAVTVQLAVPKELGMVGNNKRTLLLHPQEVRETYWQLQVPDDLDPSYQYQFPIIAYTEKNISLQQMLSVQKGKAIYTQKDIEKLLVIDEEKGYSQQIFAQCDYAREVPLGEILPVTCTISNKGSQSLDNLRFCLGSVCEAIFLKAGGTASQSIRIPTEKAGWGHIIISLDHPLVEKKTSFQYLIFDKPMLKMRVDTPETVQFGEGIPLAITLSPTSFRSPQQVEVILQGLGVEQLWSMEELLVTQELKTTIPGGLLHGKNRLRIEVAWKDGPGNQEDILIQGKASSLPERVQMIINAVLVWFSEI